MIWVVYFNVLAGLIVEFRLSPAVLCTDTTATKILCVPTCCGGDQKISKWPSGVSTDLRGENPINTGRSISNPLIFGGLGAGTRDCSGKLRDDTARTLRYFMYGLR